MEWSPVRWRGFYHSTAVELSAMLSTHRKLTGGSRSSTAPWVLDGNAAQQVSQR